MANQFAICVASRVVAILNWLIYHNTLGGILSGCHDLMHGTAHRNSGISSGRKENI